MNPIRGKPDATNSREKGFAATNSQTICKIAELDHGFVLSIFSMDNIKRIHWIYQWKFRKLEQFSQTSCLP